MSLLQFKKKRNRLSGKFAYTIKNAIAFNRVRNRWMVRIPTEILKASALRIGSRVDVRAEGKELVIEKLSGRKKISVSRRIRARLKVLPQSKR